MARLPCRIGLAVALLAVAGVGCGDDATGTGGDSGGTTSSSKSSSGTDGSSSSTAATTAASSSSSGMPVDPCAIEDGGSIGPECGIFVNPDAVAGGDGTQGAPYQGLGVALAVSDDEDYRIYVCGGIDDAPVIPEGRQIHGVTCDWTWDFALRVPWTAQPDVIPLRFQGGNDPTVVTGFAIEAVDATKASGSSIAVMVNGGALDLARVDITAGGAVDGIAGNDGVAGAPGGEGVDATVMGAGAGGTGGCQDGGIGSERIMCDMMGMCTYTEAQPPGLGGTSSVVTCTDGLDGPDGMAGAAGAVGGFGALDSQGFVPEHGQAGMAGTNGQGAGGGGAKSSTETKPGGGGGAGGCASTGSEGGTSGGSSFAIVAIDAEITFDVVTAQVGNAGDGGTGGALIPGGYGGGGGTGYCTGFCAQPAAWGCDGGIGGNGGDGGPGGGGSGGHAAIIAYVGIALVLDGLAATDPNMAQAGIGGGTAPNGQAVVALEFP